MLSHLKRYLTPEDGRWVVQGQGLEVIRDGVRVVVPPDEAIPELFTYNPLQVADLERRGRIRFEHFFGEAKALGTVVKTMKGQTRTLRRNIRELVEQRDILAQELENYRERYVRIRKAFEETE